jgi:hypothetical protein
MMQEQVTQLKLNVTNIKNSLFSSNKQIKKLKNDKKSLTFKVEKKKDFRAEEQRLETRNLGIGSGFSKIMNTVTSPVRSIFDRILDFVGLIAAGILINNLPIIIEKIQQFFDSDFIKGLGNVLGFIGNGILKLAEFVGIFPKSEQDQLEKDLKATDKAFDEDIRDADATEKDIVNLERFLGQAESETPIESTESMESDASIPRMPKTSEPVGSTSDSSSSMKSVTVNSPAQTFSSGGTVKDENSTKLSSRPIHRPKKSGVLKKTQRDANDGFKNFPLAVNGIHESTKEQEKNILAFSKMLNLSRENDMIGANNNNINNNPNNPNNPTNSNNPTNPTNFARPRVTRRLGNQSRIWNSKLAANAVTFDPEQGPDNREPGVDFSYNNIYKNYAMFDGEVIEVNDRQSPGYGGSVIIRSKDPFDSSREIDSLYAHFAPGTQSVKVGQKIRAGQYLGPVGWLGQWPGGSPAPGAGNMTGPHTSLDFFEPGTNTPAKNYRKLVNHVVGMEGRAPTSQSISPKPTAAPNITSVSPQAGNGGLLLNRSMNNQSIFIYAIQPQETFVPFPYPMPVEKIVPISSSSPQLSSIWRT